MRTLILFALSALASTHLYAATELVMHEGVKIEAQKSSSSIRVSAGKGFDRTYEWENCKLKSNMGARKERWYGSMGIYDPAPSFGFSFRGCAGIFRTVVQEGQIHFDDLQFAYKWLQRRPKNSPTVWTTDGLLVSWNIVPRRNQLNVDVWLMCINGKQPTQLEGATDSAVKVMPNQAGQTIQECAQVGKAVVGHTRSQLEADWKKMDEWFDKYNKRNREGRNAPSK